MRVISLGWGVQSFALAAMSALGVLPKVDAAIHADTTHERAETYEFARRWTPWLEEHGVRVITVKDEKAPRQIFDASNGQTYVPLFTLKNGSRGQLRRSCTQRWKIAPIRRWISQELKRRDLKKTPGIIDQWLGITFDEAERTNISDVRYSKNIYPFLTMFDRAMRRQDAIQWLIENNLDVPVKSGCVFCPFHDRATWREIKMNSDNWTLALRVDDAIRHKRQGYESFLITARVPLMDADFSNQQDHGQLSLWSEECKGYCFL